MSASESLGQTDTTRGLAMEWCLAESCGRETETAPPYDDRVALERKALNGH